MGCAGETSYLVRTTCGLCRGDQLSSENYMWAVQGDQLTSENYMWAVMVQGRFVNSRIFNIWSQRGL